MKQPPIPASESERLQALLRYQILDTAFEQAFDDLTTLAYTFVALLLLELSLVDANRQSV